jgi:hypothetical protein
LAADDVRWDYSKGFISVEVKDKPVEKTKAEK